MKQECTSCGHAFETELAPGLKEACPRCMAAFLFQEEAPTELKDPKAATQAPLPLEHGARFGDLIVGEVLGRGGMGVVYKARQPELDRDVALKVLAPELARSEEFQGRFQREAKALAALNHPNIVQVYAYGQRDGLAFLAMEYVEGSSLRQVLTGGELTAEAALRYIRQVCDALDFAHSKGVVHRDIKPENILIDVHGRLKIADFGLAKVIAPHQDARARVATVTGQVMGTPQYMAPEQTAGLSKVDHRADLYSLGVVFYEMLTGELPLGYFPLPSQRSADNDRFDDVVLKSLERDPDKRYQRASHIKKDLQEPKKGAGGRPEASTLQGLVRYGLVTLQVTAAGVGLIFAFHIARFMLADQAVKGGQAFEDLVQAFGVLIGVLVCIAGLGLWKYRHTAKRSRYGRSLALLLGLVAFGSLPITSYIAEQGKERRDRERRRLERKAEDQKRERKQAQELAPNPDPMAGINEAEQIAALMNRGELYEAGALGEELLKKYPNSPYVHGYMGRVHYRLGRFAECRASYAKAAAGVGASIWAEEKRNRSALIEFLRGDDEQAGQILETIAARAPGVAHLEELMRPRGLERTRSKAGHYIVYVDQSLEAKGGDEYAARILERLYEAFAEVFPFLRDEDLVYRCYIFSESARYLSFSRAIGHDAAGSKGFYTPAERVLVIDADPRGAAVNPYGFTAGNLRTIFHEAFHQFAGVYAPDLPLWFNEGLADYFGNARPADKKALILGKFPRFEPEVSTRYEIINEAMRAPGEALAPPLDMERFIRQTDAEFRADPTREGMNYAQGWSIIHFLLHNKDLGEKGRELIREYFKLFREGRGREAAFEEAFGKVDLGKLEAAWRLHVKAM